MVGICIAWQILSPLVYGSIVLATDSNGYPLYTAVTCLDPHLLSRGFLSGIIAFISILAGITVILAIWIRNSAYQEARTVLVASLCFFQVFFIALPTSIAASGTTLSRFLVQSSTSFVLCFVILCTMFLPRALSWSRTQTMMLFPLRSSPYTNSRSGGGTMLSSARTGGYLTYRQTQQPAFRSKVQAIQSTEKYDPTRLVTFGPGNVSEPAQGDITSAQQAGMGPEYSGGALRNSGYPEARSPLQGLSQRPAGSGFDSLMMAPKRLPAFVDPNLLSITSQPGAAAHDAGGMGLMASHNHPLDTSIVSSVMMPDGQLSGNQDYLGATLGLAPIFENGHPAFTYAYTQFATPPDASHLIDHSPILREEQEEEADSDKPTEEGQLTLT
jgi:hypothetical protein